MTRCLHIDWLEVYAIEPPASFPLDADFFRSHGVFVRERPFGSRTWREIFTIEDEHGVPVLEVRRNPPAADEQVRIIPKGAVHLRLVNARCYDRPIATIRDFMVRWGYQFKSIYRIDICLDFERFDTSDDPHAFLQRYIGGRYSKINQANISAHGTDRWEGRLWNSVSWGAPKSMVGTKMYCKSLELQVVSDKPYIRHAWFEAGLVDDPVNMLKRKGDGSFYKPVIWRLEFSLKSSVRRWRAVKGAERFYMHHTLSTYDTPAKLEAVFASLVRHYFRFKHYEEGVRKDRCRDKELFRFRPSDVTLSLETKASHVAEQTFAQRLLRAIRRYRDTLVDGALIRSCDVLIEHIERDRLFMFAASPKDALLLQRLIAERCGRADASVDECKAELLDLFADIADFF